MITLPGIGFVILNEQICENGATLANTCSDGTEAGHTGLTVRAEADNNSYPKGVKISVGQMTPIAAQLKPDKFQGEWNYTVKPAAASKPVTLK